MAKWFLVKKTHRFVSRFKTLLRKVAISSRASVPVQVSFPLTELKEIKNEYAGLLGWLYFDGDSESDALTLVTFWESRSKFNDNRIPFIRDYETGLPIVNAMRDINRSDSFWSRISTYQIVLHVAAFFGALSSIMIYYAELFESPRIIANYQGVAALRTVAGERIQLPITFTNYSSRVQLLVKDLNLNLTPSVLSPATVVFPPPIPPGGQGVATVEFSVEDPGNYLIHLESLTSSGFFPGDTPSKHQSLKLDVFGNYIETSLSMGKRQNANYLQVTCRINRDIDALQLEVINEDAADVTFYLLIGDKLLRPDYGPERDVDKERHRIFHQLVVGPLHKFEEYTFRLYLDGKPAGSWGEFMANTRVLTEPIGD